MSERTLRPPERRKLHVEVDGVGIAGTALIPSQTNGRPVVFALHGGGYTGAYFDVVGASLLDVCAAHGYGAVAIDRPGYGGSGSIPLSEEIFELQSRLLAAAIVQFAERLSAARVVLVGHSIGGMIALMIAAGSCAFELLGVATTGMGAVMPAGGAGEGLAAAATAAGVPMLEAPVEQADAVMFGPEWTFDADTRDAARASYAPVPTVELVAATRWPQTIVEVAPRVTVPVQNVLAEFDSLWDTAPASLAAFAALFTAAPFVEVQLALGTGHSIDHHRLARALHLRQIAFAEECVVWAERD